MKVTDTSRGTLRIFGISRGPFSEELTDNHVLALDVSRTGLRLWNGNRELTGPAPNQESRKFRNTVFEQKSDGGVTAGTWHALVLEIKGNDAQVLLDGHPAVTLSLNNPQPLRSLSLEADGDKQTIHCQPSRTSKTLTLSGKGYPPEIQAKVKALLPKVAVQFAP